MHIHSVIVSYNRPDLLAQCYASYKETVSIPHTLTIVDNGSERETLAWLSDHVASGDRMLFLAENKYPGYATNRGWENLPPQTTILHRSDNDFVFLPGWCEEIVRIFNSKPQVGQIGLRTNEEEENASSNVGGNNVIRRKLWDEGLRYDERPWTSYAPGITEDSYFTPAVEGLGWTWTRVKTPCVRPISTEDASDPYYRQSWKDRRIHEDKTRT